MMHARQSWIPLVVLAATGTFGAEDTDLVRATLITDTDALTGGQEFRLGVRFQIEPGWHIYWKNPGDAGLATTIALDLPPGFTAGPLQWPLPETFTQPGDIAGYGYEKDVLLWVRVRAPPTLKPGDTVPIRATARWLCCSDRCVLGEAELSGRLAVGNNAPVPGEAADLFEKWEEKLPLGIESARKAGLLDSVEVQHEEASGTRLIITWRTEPGKVIGLPVAAPGARPRDLAMRSQGRRTIIGLDRAAAMTEVLIICTDRDGASRGVVVPVELGRLNA